LEEQSKLQNNKRLIKRRVKGGERLSYAEEIQKDIEKRNTLVLNL